MSGAAEQQQRLLLRIRWIIDGYVLGEYDLYECAAQMSRAVAKHFEDATRPA